MPSSPSDPIRYYLAIAGDQIGPLSEHGVLKKLRGRTDFKDVLLWREGLDTWYAVESVPPFSEYFASAESLTEAPLGAEPVEKTNPEFLPQYEEMEPETLPPRKKSDRKPPPIPTTFAKDKEDIRPVYQREEGRISNPPFLTTQKGMTSFFLVILVGLTILYNYYSQSQKEGVSSKPEVAKIDRESRGTVLRRALSRLIIRPSETLPILATLIQENPNDAVGIEALKAATEYLRRNRRYMEAAEFLMKAQKPFQAAEYYLQPPQDYKRAEQALYLSYQQSKDKETRKKSLLKNISILLGPLNSEPSRKTATDRIKQLAKEFPQEAQQFRYYLLNKEEKIRAMFSRIISHFSDGITNLIDQRFPDISLAKDPKIEMKKNKAGLFRIEARYLGDIILGRDKLPNINLKFWSVRNQWFLVETNLTPERQRWALAQKKKLTNTMLGADAMLNYLETVHMSIFPRAPLHQVASQKPGAENSRLPASQP